MTPHSLALAANNWTDTIEEALRGEFDFSPACEMPSEAEEKAHLIGQLQGFLLLLDGLHEADKVRDRIGALIKEFTPLPAAFIV